MATGSKSKIMSGSFRNIRHIGDTSGLENVKNKVLSIGLRPDGFVYAVLDADNFQYLTLEDFQYTSGNNKEDYTLYLNHFLDNHEFLKNSFSQIHIALFTSNLILVPANHYDQKDKEKLFQFFSGEPKEHVVLEDKLNNLDAIGLYCIPIETKELLDANFGNYKLRHQGTALIESTLATNKLENRQVDVVLHVKPTFFEIILMEEEKVCLYQSFEYQVFDDLMYYLFYVLEQFDKDAADLKLLLVGETGIDCQPYSTLVRMFDKVIFPERNDAFKYAEGFDQIPGHFYYNLLNLITCG